MLLRTINSKCFARGRREMEESVRTIDSIKTFSCHYTNSRDSSYENDIDVKIISYSRLAFSFGAKAAERLKSL